jgi:hypothetical protein
MTLSLHAGYDSAFIGDILALNLFMRDFGLLNQSSEVTAALSAHIVSTCTSYTSTGNISLGHADIL